MTFWMDRDELIYSRAGFTAKMNKKRFPGVYYQAVFFFFFAAVTGYIALVFTAYVFLKRR